MYDPEADLALGLDFSTEFRFDISKVSDRFNLTLTNSCNGLLFLAGGFNDDPNSIIYNPLTKEYITLPRGDIDGRDHFQLLGFGAVSKRYKVMRIFPREPYGVQVHVVGSGLRRDVEAGRYVWPQGSYQPLSNITYLNGSAYVLWNSRPSTDELVCFDFDKEGIGEIELPDAHALYGCVCFVRLERALGDRLCVCFNVYPVKFIQHLDLWMMRNGGGGGDGELWSRVFHIDHEAGPMFGRSFRDMWPLRVLSDGKLLLFTEAHGLLCYDPDNKSLISVGLEFEQYEPFLEPVNLIPSFLRLKDQLSIVDAMVERA